MVEMTFFELVFCCSVALIDDTIARVAGIAFWIIISHHGNFAP